MSKNIYIFHPDLGIGGAERLIVDCALALKSGGHNVTIFTSHHDPDHCFPETKDGTLPVHVHGDFLPRSVFGRLSLFCATIRAFWLLLCVWLLPRYSKSRPDLVLCDQIAAPIPFYKFLLCAPVLFYCHFPDKLLAVRMPAGAGAAEPAEIVAATQRAMGPLKRMYRKPLDITEEVATGAADRVLVNSHFTQQVFSAAFPTIEAVPDVLYPTVTASLDGENREEERNLVVSLNRFERKKDVGMALEALAVIRDKNPQVYDQITLVLAGGYDSLVAENVEYYSELESRVKELNLEDHVRLVRNFSNEERKEFLSKARCLVYTPQNEHFGIVPVEAMLAGTPVVAHRSGGPKESVVDGVCGYLCEATPEDFAEKITKIMMLSREEHKEMCDAAVKNAKERFSFEAFSKRLNEIVDEMLPKDKKKKSSKKDD